MAERSFFESFRVSINQILSGDEEKTPSGSQRQHKQAAQSELESAIIVLASEVMRLPGNESAETDKLLFDFLEKNFGRAFITKRKKQVKDHLFVGAQPFTRMACEQIKTLATHDSKYEMIKLLYTIAAVDGFLTSLENKTIQKIGKYLSVPESEVLEIRDKIVRANSPFGLLEIDETRSVEKVKAAYRKMVLKYHPDKRSKATSEEDANRKFREIKKAYELILQKLED